MTFPKPILTGSTLKKFSVISLLTMTFLSCDGFIEVTERGSNTNQAGSDGISTPETDGISKTCATSESIFEDYIWPKVIEPKCISCHIDGGAAMGSSLVFTSEMSPTNFTSIQTFAETKIEGRSLLELKAINEIAHGGGEVIKRDGATHQLLVNFIDNIDGLTCDFETADPPTGPYYSGVEFLDDDVLLRRVTLALASRLPTDEELSQIRHDPSAMEAILDNLMKEEAFIIRAMDAFGDVLLTDGYETTQGGVLPARFYSNTNNWPPDYIVNREYDMWLRREPVELVGFIIRNDRPFEEILTAKYTVVSTFTSRGYGIYDEIESRFKDINDPSEYIDVELPTTLADGENVSYLWKDGKFPHAGVLSTWMWSARFLSTVTNRNRGRAREFYRQFLNVDLLEFAPLSSDTAAETAKYEKPLVTPESTCYACHVVMDPVAGLFQNYLKYKEFLPYEWDTSDIEVPGFEGTEIIGAEIGDAMPWLAERTVKEPRFKIAMVNHAYYILTQEKALLQPTDSDDPLFGSYVRAYKAQKEMIDEAVQAMEDNNQNIKFAIKSIISSNWYRSGNYNANADPEGSNVLREVELNALGLSVPISSEQLYSRLNNLLGYDEVRFRPIYISATKRRDSYMAFGGVNHRDVVDRPHFFNSIMGAMTRQIANEISCNLIPKILIDNKTTPVELFPDVDKTTTDENAIRKNLVHLHWVLLGENVEQDSAEIDRTFTLFSEVVKNGKSEITAGNETSTLIRTCQSDVLGSAEDPNYIIRGWGVMITFFLRHPKFMLQ